MEVDTHDEFLLSEWFQSWSDTGLETGMFARPARQIAAAIKRSSVVSQPTTLWLDVLFIVEPLPLDAQTHALLSRMVTAMAVAPERVGVALASRPGQAAPLADALGDSGLRVCSARIAVVLGAACAERLGTVWSKGAWGEASGFGAPVPAIYTHSLDELLKQPSLKRAVWEDLQQVMHKLSAV